MTDWCEQTFEFICIFGVEILNMNLFIMYKNKIFL